MVGAPLALVRAARRALSLELHPDHGGDLAQMQRINAAADKCEQWWAEQEATRQRQHA